MTDIITVDPAMFPQVDAYYQKQRSEALQIKNYLTVNCTLGDAFGLMLSGMKPQYDTARNSAFTAIQTIADTLEKIGDHMAAYGQDVAAEEAEKAAIFAALQAQLVPAPSVTSTPGEAEGTTADLNSTRTNQPGGAALSAAAGTLPQFAPSPPVSHAAVLPPNQSPNAAPDTTSGATSGAALGSASSVDITVNGGTANIVIENGRNGESFYAGEKISTQQNVIGGNNVFGGDRAFGQHESTVIAQQNAREAAFYERFWQEQAATDPLARSADQLRAAWESRQPIDASGAANSPGVTTLGYSNTANNSSLMHPPIFSVAPARFTTDSSQSLLNRAAS
jgi:hypothetical protein